MRLPDVAGRPWLLAAVVAAVALVLGVTCVELTQRRSEDAAVRDAALPRCLDRIHDEAECSRLIAAGHDDCAVYARQFPSRFQNRKSHLDADKYLECILLTPGGWVAQRARDKERERAEHANDLSGH